MRPNRHAIKALRKALNMSLRDLQELSGHDRGYLSRIERGEVLRVADSTVEDVAAAMGVPSAAITYDTPQEMT